MIDVFTDYTLLNSLLRIKNPDNPEKLEEKRNPNRFLMDFAKSKGWKYLGIADDCAGGLLEFYLACKEEGIKPLLGVRFRVSKSLDNVLDGQIILYAQNKNGYHNLMKLSSKASVDGFVKDNANLLIEWLNTDLSKDILCVLPIGESPNELLNDDGKFIINNLKVIFKGKLFFGLYNRDTAIDDIWLRKAHESKTPYLFLSGAKYFKSSDSKAYRTLRAISERSPYDKVFESIWLDESIENAEKHFYEYQHLAYLDKFLSLIDIDIPTPGLKVPRFPVPAPFQNSYDYLVSLCREGYKSKASEFDDIKKVKDRMAMELNVIKTCQLADYFLLVYDICQYCDQNKVPRGIGRGSVGGSLCAYFLNIHSVNPLKYGLLFERFLNPDRTRPVEFNGEQYLTDAPDIDLDIGQIERQQVIEWLRQKYGFLSKISTYTTLSSKACIKDVMRSFYKTEREAMFISSMIDSLFGKTDGLEATYEKEGKEKFREWVKANKEIFDIAVQIEDIKKNCSVHAAGVLVSDTDIADRAPLILANSTGEEIKRDVCCAYSLDFAAKASLLKIDILGIRSLNVLANAIDIINKNQKAPPPAPEPIKEEIKPEAPVYKPQTEAFDKFLKQYA